MFMALVTSILQQNSKFLAISVIPTFLGDLGAKMEIGPITHQIEIKNLKVTNSLDYCLFSDFLTDKDIPCPFQKG